MKTSVKLILIIALSILAVVVVSVLVSVFNRQIVKEITEYKPGTPEYEAAVALNLQNYSDSELIWAQDDGVTIAVTNEQDQSSRYIVVAQNSKGIYTNNMDEFFVLGGSQKSLGFGEKTDAASLYRIGEKFIVTVPVYGYSTDSKQAMDINRVRVYDNEGRELKVIKGDQFALFYLIENKMFADDYQIFLEYEGQVYTVLDMREMHLYHKILE